MAVAVRQRRLQQHAVEARARVRMQVGRPRAVAPAPSPRARLPGIALARVRGERSGRFVEVVHASVAPGASAASRQHRFSSSRTLPGQSCACSRSSAAGDKRFAGACSLPAAAARKRRASRDVLAPFAQRRQPQPHHVEPVQQVRAEAAVGDQRFQRLVRGRDHAHVDADQLAPADAEEFAFGQHPQQKRVCNAGGMSPISSRNKGAAVGLLEPADMAFLRAGERASLVAEQVLSSSSEGIAAVLSAMKGLRARAIRGATRATSSLPVPVSPVINTFSGAAATPHRAEQRLHPRRSPSSCGVSSRVAGAGCAGASPGAFDGCASGKARAAS